MVVLGSRSKLLGFSDGYGSESCCCCCCYHFLCLAMAITAIAAAACKSADQKRQGALAGPPADDAYLDAGQEHPTAIARREGSSSSRGAGEAAAAGGERGRVQPQAVVV